MTTTALVYVSIYLGGLVFALGTIWRAVQYARSPSHLRWELYPVPHEEAHRAAHGGSYFEMLDWWTRPPQYNLWGEVKAMAQEIFFLKGLWEFNRSLWFRSFPFHVGLYLTFGTIVLLGIQAGLAILLPHALTAGAAGFLSTLYILTGWLGAALTIAGAAALLGRRLSDKSLRIYTTAGDVFNLLFFIVAFGIVLAGYTLRGASFPGLLPFTRGLLVFDTHVKVPGLLSFGIVLGALLIAYIPLTHMSHFVAKYFTYHSVRWDDTASVHNTKLQQRMAEYLTLRPTWAAGHFQGGGIKSWAEIATSNPAQGVKK